MYICWIGHVGTWVTDLADLNKARIDYTYTLTQTPNMKRTV